MFFFRQGVYKKKGKGDVTISSPLLENFESNNYK